MTERSKSPTIEQSYNHNISTPFFAPKTASPPTSRRKTISKQLSDTSNNSNYSDYPPPEFISKLSPTRKVQTIGNYELLKTIGSGQFGKVKLARHILSQEMVAIKVINKTKLNADNIKALECEVSILKQLRHPNIVRLYEVIETENFLCLVLEYVNGGEILDYIAMQSNNLSEDKARDLFRQIISAVSFCHNQSIVHRDLKCENLLIDSNHTIKLIDFGLSSHWSPDSLLKTPCGSPFYAAPEIIKHKQYVGPEVDVWSLGVLLYVFMFGTQPFMGDDLLSIYQKIIKAQYNIPSNNANVSDDFVNILDRILVVDPKSRITMEDILTHPWVVGDDNWSPNYYMQSFNPHYPSSIDQIDKNIINHVEYLGFSPQFTIESVLRNEFNAVYSLYFLLHEKQRRNLSYQQIYPQHSNSLSSPCLKVNPSQQSSITKFIPNRLPAASKSSTVKLTSVQRKKLHKRACSEIPAVFLSSLPNSFAAPRR